MRKEVQRYKQQKNAVSGDNTVGGVDPRVTLGEGTIRVEESTTTGGDSTVEKGGTEAQTMK